MLRFSNEAQKGRFIASVAATCISLACGTNYVYSAWAPQFAQKLRLSTTQSNLIGLFGNLGMYSVGFLIGLFVDTKGPRPATLVGAMLMLVGYLPLHRAYDAGSGSIPLLCAFSFLSGAGGCTSFAAAVKTSALNWPHNRGTATAFPLAAFGLSAFFFSLCGSILFPGDPSAFLALLAWGTSGITIVGFFFLKVYPDTSSYSAVPAVPALDHDSIRPRNSLSLDGAAHNIGGRNHEAPIRRPDGTLEPGESSTFNAASTSTSTSTDSSSPSSPPPQSSSSFPPPPPLSSSPPISSLDSELPPSSASLPVAADTLPPSEQPGLHTYHFIAPRGQLVAAADNVQVFPITDDTTPLLLSEASSIMTNREHETTTCSEPLHRYRSHSQSHSHGRKRGGSNAAIDTVLSRHTDIRGFALLTNRGFWQLWGIMAILAGIGLMTINNIGNDAKALWKSFDPSKDESFLVNRQQLHVSILSVFSFSGRLLSGVGSDFLVIRLNASRIWCILISSFLFTLAQLLALNIANPNYLVLVSALSGLAYGSLFGVFPSIIAETFGIKGLSQNWGFITMAPVISSNVFNIYYGKMYDSHSQKIGDSGEMVCLDGLDCYRGAYWLTFLAGVGGMALTLFTIRWQYRQLLLLQKGKIEED